MNKRFENKLNMIITVEDLLRNDGAPVQILPALQRGASDLSAKREEIQLKDRKRDSVAVGKTAEKRAAERNLINTVMVIALPVYAWAVEELNAEVMGTCNITRSYLTRIRDTELINLAERIHAVTEANINSVADYGVSAEKLNVLRNAIDSYQAAMGNRDSSVAEKISAGVSLKTLFQEADNILKNRLDNIVEAIKEDHIDFYNGYKAARVIKDL